MSICQRADGRWIVRFKEDGTWKQKAFREVEEARAFDHEMADALINAERLTVLECVVAFLRNVPHNDDLIKRYERLVLYGPAKEIKDRFADTLTRRDLEAMREECRAMGHSPVTVNWYTSKISAALNWCADQDLIAENPWKKYKPLPERHKSRTGTLEAFRRLYPFLPAWLQWAAKTTLALCLRPGVKELFSLRWTAFLWDENCVEVYMPKVKAYKRVYPPAAYLAEAAERRANAQETDYVCPCPRGKPSIRYKDAWRAACKRAGIHPMPMYALRHIAASQMLAAGADLAAVAAQLGHKNITTTGAFYTHAIAGAQQRAGEMLALVQF